MKRKHFILALVAMLWSFSFTAFAQETVVVNSFEELKAEIGKRVKGTRANAARSAANVTTDWTDTEFGTVKLGNDIVLSETLEVGNTYELTLDLNGHTISPAQGTNNYFINLGSTTIHDDSDAQTGTINCAIQNGNEEIDYAYLEIQGGTVKSLDADGAAVTNYAKCVISGGKFFSEYVGLTNYNEMTVDGGDNSDVYIEGKTYSIKNSSALTVDNAVIAGTEDSYLAEGSNATASFGDNVTYYNVALNGQGYASLQEAVNDAADGDLIRLFGNITESATVEIKKAITIDGNGKSLTNAIKVSETTGNVSITDLTVAAGDEYALQVESSAKVNVTDSELSGTGAVKASVGTVVLKDTDLNGSGADVIYVASNVIINLNGGKIAASSANNAFIIGGAEGCTGAQLSIMTTEIALGGVKNYINLNTDNNTVKLHKTFETDLYNKGYAIEAKGIALTVYNAVAHVNVNGKNYRTLAEALDAATSGSVVTLLWEDYKAPISMAGTVAGNKTVTITGTAQVDWSKGWFYVGRNATGNGKVIFNNANLTSVSNSTSLGINVSGSKKDSDTTNDGAVELENSTIVLDYLINKGTMSLNNSTLTVKNGFATGGRPASETESGVDATATMTLNNGSKLVVNNHNGQGLGYEAIGVMNVNSGSTFETTQAFLVTAKGTMNVNGGTVKIAGKLTNAGTVYATGEANLDATVTGAGWFYMNGVSLDADTKLDGAKVAFINGTNNVVGSTIKNGWFNVGIGQNAAAETAAKFASANGIALGDVTVNVSENAVVDGNGESYSGWVGSAYSAEKTLHTYTLNITNSLATFGYMHVSKDGAITVDGRSADNNKYTYDNANVNFYAGDFIINGKVTFNNADVWAKYTKMSVDHADGVLNINGDTKFESSIHNGSNTGVSLKFWEAGQVNVEKDATVEVDNQTVLVEGAELNIAGNVTAKGAVTGDGTITLTDAAAVYTAPADLTVGTTVDNKIVVYENGAYLLKDAVAKIGDVCYLTFAEAMTAANAMTGEVTVEVLAAVEFVDGMELNGSYTTINFVGKNAEAKMTINQTAGGDYLEAHGKNVNFTDLTLAKANPAWSGNSGHMGNYFTVQGGTATYTNCTFLNGACTSGGTATYNDCTFQNAKEYGLWAYDDALVTVNGGTFDSKKGIKVYSEDETSVTTTLTVQNATFTENVTDKPAVAVGYAASVTLIGNTYNNPTAHVELDSGSDADCEGVTFVAQDANGNDISATLNMTDRSNSNAACGVLVDGKVYTTVTTAVQDAKDGSNVTILYSTEEAVEFVPGVNINLAEGVTADNVIVADRLTDYVVLPEDVNESNFVFKFGTNTVTDGTNYYPTLQAAVEAVAGQANAVLYCKPGANVGSLQHAPVTSTLTIYGNNANVTGGDERDFDLGNTDPSLGKDITADMTLTVKRLNGCGAWGNKATEHTVNLVFENCANMGKVFITGTTGTLNITMTDCAFEGVIKEAVYSNADGAITLTNVAFSNLNKAVNLNHKAAGTQTVTIDGCSFTNCGADVAEDQIPVRVLSSNELGKSVLTVNNSTFAGTPTGGADILLDYGVGVTEASVTNTAANVKPENKAGNAEMVAVAKETAYNYSNAVAKIGEVCYTSLDLAIKYVENGEAITLMEDLTYTDYVYASGKTTAINIANKKNFTLDLAGKTIAGTNCTENSYELITVGTGTTLTIEDSSAEKTGKISYTGTRATADGWMRRCHTIYNQGTLVLNGGTIENNTPATAEAVASAIDNNASWGKEGYLTVNGGTVISTSYYAVRTDVNTHNTTANGTLKAQTTFNGGTVYGFYLMDRGSDLTNMPVNSIEFSVADAATIRPCEYNGQALRFHVNAKSAYDLTVSENATIEGTIKGAVTKIGNKYYAYLQDAIDACVAGETTLSLLEDVKEDVVITQQEGVNIVIDGAEKTFTGLVTVFGNGRQSGAETLTIKNVNFVAKEGADACILSPDREAQTPAKYSYSHNVTVENCTFTDPDGAVNCAAIRHNDGGDKNWTVKKCTVDATMHSLLQVNNVEGKLVVDNCTVKSKNGLNLNSCTNVELTNNTIEVKGYAVRTGVNSGGNLGEAKTYVFNNNTLKTDNSEGDAVIVFRASTVDANLSMNKNVVSGTTHISGNTAATKLAIDANYWDGKNAPVATTAVRVNSYYADAERQTLVHNHFGQNFIGYTDTYRIWGEVWGNAFESFVIKVLDANGNVMGTTSLNNIDGIIDGDVTATWSLLFDVTSNNYEHWTMEWTTAPTIANMPALVELWVDGEKVGSGPVQLNMADDVAKKTVAITKDGNIKAFHTSLTAAIAAAQEGEVIVLLEDVANAEVYTVAAGKTITLDLNGKTIAGTDNTAKNFGLFQNNGTLTIEDSSVDKTGKITLTATVDSDWSRYSAVISNNPGGTLTVNGGTIEHLGGTDMAYGIDNLTNGTIGDVNCTINGGTIKSTYRAIRQFLNSDSKENNLTINGGTIEGDNKSIFFHDPSKKANKGTLTIAEDAVVKGDVYLFVTEGSTEWPVEVSIAAAALADGSTVTSKNVPAHLAVDNVNGTWGKVNAVVTVGGKGYTTLAEAVEAAEAGAEVVVLADGIGAGVVINKDITIDFGGFTYTFNKGVGSSANTESNGLQILQGNTVTLKNGTLNVAEDAKATFYTIIQNYANLTVENMTLDGTNLDKWATTDGDSYVLSINSGNVVIKGETNITANNDGDKAFAFDACKYQSYEAPVVTVETTGHIAGLIESTATIVIKDGTYTMDVTQWCAEGVTAEPVEVNGELVYTIVRGITIIDGQLTEFTNDQDKENCYIRYERTFTNVNKWQALYVPFEIPVKTLTELGYEVAYLYDVHNKVVAGEEIDPTAIESIHFVKITKGTLRANYPYIIRPTATADLKLVLEFNNATLFGTTKDDMISVESSTTTTRYIFAGTYTRTKRATLTGDDNIPCYAIWPDGVWYPMTADNNLGAFRIFMYIVNKDGSPVIVDEEAAKSIQIRIIGEENEDGTTLIYDVEADEQTVDYIYDLQGRRVLEPQKGGLYIVNGKKVVF